jgi:hypothetical protein
MLKTAALSALPAGAVGPIGHLGASGPPGPAGAAALLGPVGPAGAVEAGVGPAPRFDALLEEVERHLGQAGVRPLAAEVLLRGCSPVTRRAWEGRLSQLGSEELAASYPNAATLATFLRDPVIRCAGVTALQQAALAFFVRQPLAAGTQVVTDVETAQRPAGVRSPETVQNRAMRISTPIYTADIAVVSALYVLDVIGSVRDLALAVAQLREKAEKHARQNSDGSQVFECWAAITLPEVYITVDRGIDIQFLAHLLVDGQFYQPQA